MAELTFRELMTLAPLGPDVFLGASLDYPMKRVFGGQAVAQALAAALATVPPPAAVHSVHASFLRSGAPAEPIRYEVERTRDGRSFTSRRVVARQAAGVLLTATVSCHVPEPGEVSVQAVTAPDVALPADPLGPASRISALERRMLPAPPGRGLTWARIRDRDPAGDPALAVCGLAYLTDDGPTNAVRSNHPRMIAGRYEDRLTLFMNASLDHAVWFHRPVTLGEWLLFDVRSPGLVGGRGLALGEVFQADGTHVATFAQEVLLRERATRP